MFAPITSEIYRAPLNEEVVEACRKTSCGVKQAAVQLGRTLPSLLDEGCEFSYSTASQKVFFIGSRQLEEASTATINHYEDGRWKSWTLENLRTCAERVAIALQQRKGIEKGDRVALLMDSNVPFVMADIGSLLAQLVTVPMLPEQSIEVTQYILKETEASVLVVSRLQQVEKLLPVLSKLATLRLIVVADTSDSWKENELAQEQLDKLAAIQWSLPDAVELVGIEALQQEALWSKEKAQRMRAQISPTDLATIVYTLGRDGLPLGAMLTHENLSGSVLAAFSTLPCLRKGPKEVALAFLPLHHIFARGFVYGSLSFGQSLYFSTPRRVMKHLRELKPTVFFTVPRLLEKVYEGWLAATFLDDSNRTKQRPKHKALPSFYFKQLALSWAWHLAHRYKADTTQSVMYRAQLWIARQTVLKPLRQLFGGRLKCFITGGAALPDKVMTLMLAAGLNLCQGYGLTEASSTLSFTRRHWVRAGTVGVPMPGVEMTLTSDGEVMVKAPYVMQGYYRNPEATQAALENGWLHTGDRGHFSSDGLLTITGQKKALFKLSIGEYVAPEPIEQALQTSSLIERALVVGPGQKFCGLLIFPDAAALATRAQQLGLALPIELLVEQPQIVALYQSLVDRVNASLPTWSTVKRFQLVAADSVEGAVGLEKCDRSSLLSSDRALLYKTFSQEIENIYNPSQPETVPISVTESILESVHQLCMLVPSVLSIKKGSPHHV